jgi:PKD repeat protein
MSRLRFSGILLLALLLALIASACNLGSSDSAQQVTLTGAQTGTVLPTRTPITTGAPTTLPLTSTGPTGLPTLLRPTNQPTSSGAGGGVFPTRVVVLPPTQVFPTNTALPVNIVILSPVPGNVVAGNVQVLGAATHPQFLQYQLEYGPDPNPGNLWYPATAAVQQPVLNGLLGIWNTTATPDGTYALRLRVYMRDGTTLSTIVNNVRVQNRANTPVPSPTPNIPRPIAAFSEDRSSGQVPLTVRFINQSTGDITSYSWNFGDGSSSSEASPVKTFNSPGLFNVTLTVNGPGGSSNVSRQINAQSPTAPVAEFNQNTLSGFAPLTVQFFDQSTGTVTSRLWNFSDGGASNETNPVHTFAIPGIYNVFLTVTGPGGSSTATRQINVQNPATATWTASPIPPTATWTSSPVPPTATFTTTPVPPTATFTSTPVTPTATLTSTTIPLPVPFFTGVPSQSDPLTVQFTSQSTGEITNYTWDFGDGTPNSNEQNPTHTYARPGTYTVTLTVAGPGGQNALQSAITVTQALNAAFTVARQQDNGLVFQFTNQSTGDITAYAWDFGDGNTSADANPTHTYSSGGQYTVTLTVTERGGATDSATEQITASEALRADFTWNPVTGSPLVIQFNSTSRGEAIGFRWDFGDGGSSDEQNPQHTYAAGGQYTVTLTVMGRDRTTAETSQIVTVIQPVTAAFTASQTPGTLGVQFTSTSSGQIASYAWDFGDGTTSNEPNPQHTYGSANVYTVTLTVTDANGGSDSEQQNVAVTQPLDAAFTAAPTPGTLGVQFTSTSSGQVAAYNWDFGDGSTSTEQNPQHTYATPGDYTVTLTVTDANGTSDNTQQAVTVAQPLEAAFTASPVLDSLSVQFTSTSTGPIAAYNWDFGDGNTSTEQNPLHTYAVPGDYTVTLTVTDANGGSDNTQQNVSVTQPISASFTAAPDANDPLSVQFTSQVTGNIVIYSWDFGDGGTNNDPNPRHTYAAAGTYNVTLTVTDANGATTNATQQVTVTAPAATAAPLTLEIGATPTEVDPLTYQFSATTNGSLVTYTWDFGDGTTSNEPNPQHTFPNAGTYTVTLNATDANGQPLTATTTVEVVGGGRAGDITQQPGLADNAPVVPEIGTLRENLRRIFDTSGNDIVGQIARAGDESLNANGFLTPFGDGDYNLGDYADLDPIISFYTAADLGGGLNTLNNFSEAVEVGWTSGHLLDPANTTSGSCDAASGETPLACELRVHPGSVILISVGYHDIANGVAVETFRQNLQTIVQTAINSGVIPVLYTIRPGQDVDLTRQFNDVIIDVANTNQIPVVNAWRLLSSLPDPALNAAPAGGGDLSADSVGNYGVNALNLATLQTLQSLRDTVFPEA